MVVGERYGLLLQCRLLILEELSVEFDFVFFFYYRGYAVVKPLQEMTEVDCDGVIGQMDRLHYLRNFMRWECQLDILK